MQVTTETELMKNQKHAEVMAPDRGFEVLQTIEGDAIFFSIGTDNVLYVTREIRASQTGWTKVDLSSSLATSHPGDTIAVKSFTLSQNPQTLAFDIALTLTAAGRVDFLYLCMEFSGSAESWADGIQWTLIPFDAASIAPPTPFTIANAYIMGIPSPVGPTMQSIFVDIERDPRNPLQLLDRYYILPNSNPRWVRHTLAIDLKAGSVSSSLGRRANDHTLGIYTFGMISDIQELIYAPQTNYFDPNLPPLAARLQLPAGSTAFASAMNNEKLSSLFVAATAGIFLFTPENQHDQATPVLVVPSSTVGSNNIFARVNTLSASTDRSRTVVWALNAQGDLFHVSCPAGSEITPEAWSSPLPLSSGVEGYSFYLNTQSSNNVLFAHLSGQQLTQYTQDPITSSWAQRALLLPPTDIKDMIEYNSFTTHIKITDGNLVAIPNTAATLTSSSPVTIYINDVYHVITPTIPVDMVSDEVGTITLIQETQSLAAVSFQLTISGPTNLVIPIDPLSNAMERLSTIQSGADLTKVQIKTAQGVQKPLVPSTVSSGDRDAAAKSITQLLKIKDSLPADGSKMNPSTTASSMHEGPNQIWGVMLNDGGDMQYVEGDEAHALLRIPKLVKLAPKQIPSQKQTTDSDWDKPLEVAPGDLFNWLKSAWHEAEEFMVKLEDGIYHFMIKVGEAVYAAILDCASVVLFAVEYVFNKVKIFVEGIVAWLGFLFDWGDILRTHSVMKNIVKQGLTRAINSIDALEATITTLFNSIEDEINAFAGITDPGQSIGTQQRKGSSMPAQNAPQSNWAVHHTKNGLSSATTSHIESNTDSSLFDQILGKFEALVTDEGAFLMTSIQQIKEQVVDHFSNLTAIEVVTKIMAIVADFLIKTAREFVLKTIDIGKILAPSILGLLDAPLEIPILSVIYEEITKGEKLSFLDLTCLAGAIMATIVFKIIGKKAPFPDNSETTALIKAPDFATLATILSGKPNSTDSVKTKLGDTTTSGTNGDQELEKRILGGADLRPIDIAVIILDIATVPASFLLVLNGNAKRLVPSPEVPEPLLRWLSVVYYAVYCGPDIVFAFLQPGAGDWPTITNDAITIISLLKTCVDNHEVGCKNEGWTTRNSAICETIINFVWLLPAFSSIARNKSRKASDWVSFASDLAFDIGGILTVGTCDRIWLLAIPDPVRRLVVTKEFHLATMLLSYTYGGLSCATGGLLIDGK